MHEEQQPLSRCGEQGRWHSEYNNWPLVYINIHIWQISVKLWFRFKRLNNASIILCYSKTCLGSSHRHINKKKIKTHTHPTPCNVGSTLNFKTVYAPYLNCLCPSYLLLSIKIPNAICTEIKTVGNKTSATSLLSVFSFWHEQASANSPRFPCVSQYKNMELKL